MKTLITTLLIFSLLNLELRAEEPKKNAATIGVGCMVLAIGAIVVVGLILICRKIPDPNKPNNPPPPPPVPPTNRPPTNPTVKPKQRLLLPNTIVYQTIVTNADGTMSPGWNMIVVAVQQATNLSAPWTTRNFVTNWIGPAGEVVSVLSDSAGRPLQTNWTVVQGTNDTLIDFEGTESTWEPRKFYRMQVLP